MATLQSKFELKLTQNSILLLQANYWCQPGQEVEMTLMSPSLFAVRDFDSLSCLRNFFIPLSSKNLVVGIVVRNIGSKTMTIASSLGVPTDLGDSSNGISHF